MIKTLRLLGDVEIVCCVSVSWRKVHHQLSRARINRFDVTEYCNEPVIEYALRMRWFVRLHTRLGNSQRSMKVR